MKPFAMFAFLMAAMFSPLQAATLKIVAAENFYGKIAQKIAGDSATVTSILSNPNQDPHEFTTNVATAKAVADADIVIYSGIDYDPWMEKLLATKAHANRFVICAATLIDAKNGDNPHIWYDPKTMPALAEKLTDLLAKANPAAAVDYQKRLADLNASMAPVLSKIASLKADYQGTTVTATEPVFGYMTNALGLKMLNYDFQIKVMNDAEPTADETATFEKSLTSKTARVLFYNSQVTDPTTDRLQNIAKQSGIPIVGVTETEPAEQPDYAGWILHQLDQVEAALGGKSH